MSNAYCPTCRWPAALCDCPDRQRNPRRYISVQRAGRRDTERNHRAQDAAWGRHWDAESKGGGR